MADTQTQDWSNYWQGRAASESGAALVGVGIETDAEIAAFWDGVLAGLPKSANILDLACGAGSVLRRAKEAGFKNLTGADISDKAIETLKTEFPAVRTVITPADKTPFEDGEFDLVASQFGFEYAGAKKTAIEIARLVGAGGRFVAISHKSGGAIEAEVKGKLEAAKAIAATGFISSARTIFEVDFSGADDAKFAEAAKAFRPAQDSLMTIAKKEQGLAAHLYAGTQQLYENRAKYELDDILGWLDGVHAENTAFIGRMESMIKAALSKDDIAAIHQAFSDQGMKLESAEVLHLGPNKDEAGWIIRATRPA